MKKELQERSTAILLAIVTLAAILLAGKNFQKESEFAIPTDGVWWVEAGDHLQAERVHAQGPGERAGIKAGDKLYEANDQVVGNAAGLERQLYKKGVYSEVKYLFLCPLTHLALTANWFLPDVKNGGRQ